MLDTVSLAGRTALVTGGNRASGVRSRIALAEAGADVAVVARDDRLNASIVEEIQGRGRRAISVVADVTGADDVERAVASCVSGLGRVDVLVNNAGVAIHGPALDVPDEEWDWVLDLNLMALWRCSRAAVGQMIEQSAQDSCGGVI